MKAENYLRFADIAYETVVSDPRKSPSGQIPYVTVDGATITDSQRIIEHFEAGRDTPIDADLSDAARAWALLLRERVEDELYWQITYMRWADPAGWSVFLPDLQRYLPGWKKHLLPIVIRTSLLRQMRRRGMTRHDPQQSYAPGIALIDALSDILAEQPYFLGDRLRTLDLSLYAFLANILDQPYSNILQEHAQKRANLRDYCTRMKMQLWTERRR